MRPRTRHIACVLVSVLAVAQPVWAGQAATAAGTLPFQTGLLSGNSAILAGHLKPLDFRTEWVKYPRARIRIAELIGEIKALEYAGRRDYRALLLPFEKSYRQGFDQVFIAPGGKVVVIEAKGGGAPINTAYGYPQGSPEWAVEGAARILRSSRASPAEKRAALQILEAAQRKSLRVEVVRTRHVLGTPGDPELVRSAESTQGTAKLARQRLQELGDDVPQGDVAAKTTHAARRFFVRGGVVILITTAISGSVNGSRYLRGELTDREALGNLAVDNGAAGASWLTAEGTVALAGTMAGRSAQAGVGLGVGYFVFQCSRDVANVLRGETNPNDLAERGIDNGVKAAAAGIGTWLIVAAVCDPEPSTKSLLLVGAGMILLVESTYPRVKALFDGRYVAEQAFYARLPEHMKQASPQEWVREDRPLEKLGKTWGPRIGEASQRSDAWPIMRAGSNQRPAGVPSLW